MRPILLLLALTLASAAHLGAQTGVMRASATILPPALAEVSEDEVRVRRDRQGRVEVAVPLTSGRPGRVVGVRAGSATRAVSLPAGLATATGAPASAGERWTVTLSYPPKTAPARPEDTVVLYLVDS